MTKVALLLLDKHMEIEKCIILNLQNCIEIKDVSELVKDYVKEKYYSYIISGDYDYSIVSEEVDIKVDEQKDVTSI